MAHLFSQRNLTLVVGCITPLLLSACSGSYGASRYGECTQPCMTNYQQSYTQPAYMETYYQVPVAPAPIAAPAPVTLPDPVPAPVSSPSADITCPSGTILQDDNTCLQVEQPTYTPPTYTPAPAPVVGYTPPPAPRPPVYKPKRK